MVSWPDSDPENVSWGTFKGLCQIRVTFGFFFGKKNQIDPLWNWSIWCLWRGLRFRYAPDMPGGCLKWHNKDSRGIRTVLKHGNELKSDHNLPLQNWKILIFRRPVNDIPL